MAQKKFARTTVKGHPATFFVIVIIVALCAVLTVTGLTLPYQQADGSQMKIKGARDIRFGIDIRGGVEAVLAPKDFKGKPTEQQIEAAVQVLNFRLDQLQILDREVTPSPASGRIIVRFPWKSDEKNFNPEHALKELGEMARLTFVGPDGSIVVDGSDVKSATAVFDPQTHRPMVSLEFNAKGTKLFAEGTRKFLNQPIAIKLDEKVISSPNVNSVIEEGRAVIEGNFTVDEARDLAAKINGGALPFALEAVSSRTISPKLGQNSLNVMVQAGTLAFVLICIFMLVYYRLPGFVACISLIAQIIGILLAISIPQQTLTLQGIAGIILSIGMGVDANIIISERIKEEANTGASLPTFLANGFSRAFSSVMDSNVTVAIAAIVLMIFGSGSILSFGYSLLVGVILNGITGVWMTRKMIASLSSYRFLQKPGLYGKKRVKDEASLDASKA